jgi:hypothetical protein
MISIEDRKSTWGNSLESAFILLMVSPAEKKET